MKEKNHPFTNMSKEHILFIKKFDLEQQYVEVQYGKNSEGFSLILSLNKQFEMP